MDTDDRINRISRNFLFFLQSKGLIEERKSSLRDRGHGLTGLVFIHTIQALFRRRLIVWPDFSYQKSGQEIIYLCGLKEQSDWARNIFLFFQKKVL